MCRYKLDTGFYVFVLTANGTNVAHGGNPRYGRHPVLALAGLLANRLTSDPVGNASYVNQTLSSILLAAGVTSITGATLNTEFVTAADTSQWSWVTYPWSTTASTTVYTKRAVVGPAGTRGLSQKYYLGAGYNSEQGAYHLRLVLLMHGTSPDAQCVVPTLQPNNAL